MVTVGHADTPSLGPRAGIIVNSDDFGLDDHGSRRIAECASTGGLSSATAMMFMAGTDAAGCLARATPRMGVGLHLNLDEPLTGDVAPAVHARWKAACAVMTRPGARRRFGSRSGNLAVARAIDDQVAAFHEVFGRAPTHLDGHHHLHQTPRVLLSHALPAGLPLRLRRGCGDRAAHVRGLLMRARGHRTTAAFCDVRDIFADPATGLAEARKGLSDDDVLEVMVHALWDDEYAFLRGESWLAAVAGWRLVDFGAL